MNEGGRSVITNIRDYFKCEADFTQCELLRVNKVSFWCSLVLGY